jgi:hypothetical protein
MDRLEPIQRSVSTSDSDDAEQQPEIEPITCISFTELCGHLFQAGRFGLEHTLEVEQTVATMIAVILSTTTTGGQLGLRVVGNPGSAKSTIAELLSCCPQLVYARSKFTGIVSGWASIKKSQNMAARMNNHCVLIKDADLLMQQSNLKQIEAEIRDALGDGVIRAEYRTGREFTVFTLFSMIMCGTHILKQLDDALLGARFLDIYIHKRGSDTKRIVRRAIRSQFDTIRAQLGGEKWNGQSGATNGQVDHEQEVSQSGSSQKRKEMILKLGPPMVGFLQHKHQQIINKLNVVPLTEEQEDTIHAMGEFIAHLRLKVKRGQDREMAFRPEREIGTRLGEQITRLLIYLSIVLQNRGENEPYVIGDQEFAIIRKMLCDTVDGFPFEVVNHLYTQKTQGATQLDISSHIGIGTSTVWNILQDLRLGGVVTSFRGNPTTNRGNPASVWILMPRMIELCRKVGL